MHHRGTAETAHTPRWAALVLMRFILGLLLAVLPAHSSLESVAQQTPLATAAHPLPAKVSQAGPAHPGPTGALPHGEGARRMGQKLRAIFAASDWKLDPGKQSERITYLQVVLSHNLSANDEITVRMELASEQLRAGFS